MVEGNTRNKVRVLQVAGTMNTGGAEQLLVNVLRHIDREACAFDFLYFTEKPCDYDHLVEAAGAEIHRIADPGLVGWMRHVTRVYALYRLFRRHKYDVVHVHTQF